MAYRYDFSEENIPRTLHTIFADYDTKTHELTIIDYMVNIATIHEFTIISSHLEIPQRLAFGYSGLCSHSFDSSTPTGGKFPSVLAKRVAIIIFLAKIQRQPFEACS